jgi:hypothetical protein
VKTLPEHLADLRSGGYAASGMQDLTGDTLWTLTDKGRMHADQWS